MTPADFLLRFPEFKDQDSGRIGLFIVEAIPQFSEPDWGSNYAQGIGLLVAHNLTIADQNARGGGAGVVTISRRVGDISSTISEAALLNTMTDPMMRTTYGQEYRRLQKLYFTSAFAL